MLVVDSTQVEAKILRRGADGTWAENAENIAAGGTIRLASIDLAFQLADAYRDTFLAEPGADTGRLLRNSSHR